MAKPINDGGPAMPTELGRDGAQAATDNPHTYRHSGITLRQWYSGHAPPMPADLNRLALEYADVDNSTTHREKCDTYLSILAEWSHMYADAMLAHEAKEREE